MDLRKEIEGKEERLQERLETALKNNDIESFREATADLKSIKAIKEVELRSRIVGGTDEDQEEIDRLGLIGYLKKTSAEMMFAEKNESGEFMTIEDINEISEFAEDLMRYERM